MHTLTSSHAHPEEWKRAQLARMRWIATALLILVLMVLIVSSLAAARYPALAWVRAFAEAATVGAVADWFAVVALFRHPLGVPLAHTAIIPRNKDRIGRSLGQFVERNFLTPDNIVKKLAQACIAERLAAWLSQPANSALAAQRVGAAIPALLEALEDEDMRRLLDGALTPQLERLDAGRLAAHGLALLTAEGRHQQLLDAALSMMERWVSTNREMLTAKFGEVSRYTPQFIDRYIVDRLIAGAADLLQQVTHDPAHELRVKFDQAILRLLDDLQHSERYRAQAEAIKHEVLAHFKERQWVRSLWRIGREKIMADLSRDHSIIRTQIAEMLMTLGAALAKDPHLQHKLDGWIGRAVEVLAVRNRHEISLLIEEIVRGWDARDMADKAELEIGRDLQYIRINGMVVGGLVGLLLYALSKFL